jgi:soluble lytic murein transglycosylase
LAALAISRIARSDPIMAATQLARIESRLQPEERAWAWSQIGWRAALQHMDGALGWYEKAGATPLSDEVAQWKVRAALRALDWGAVRSAIEAMPPELAGQTAWTYWLGRAYRAGGRLDEANTLFLKIAGQPNFYGNLADEELGRATETPPRAAAPTREEVARIAADPAIRRALALFRADLRSEGVREWNWALRGSCWRRPTSPSGPACTTGPSPPPIGPRTSTITGCATCPRSASRCVRRRVTSRSTMPGSMA